jgi:NADH:ubiquinone reductase (H+-translocating)
MTQMGKDKAHKPRLVIVGAGFGGLYAARALRRADIHLTVVDRHIMVQDFRAIDPREARILLVEGGPCLLPEYPKDLSDEVLKNSSVSLVNQDGVFIGDHQIIGWVAWWSSTFSSRSASRIGFRWLSIGRGRILPTGARLDW